MLFRPSMVKDIENAGCIQDASVIYSLWNGYLKEERLSWFHEWLDSNNISINHCHTSGHAPLNELKTLAKALKPDRLVPVHSFVPDICNEFFDNVEIIEDGQWREA
jgi:ribonuclease J